MILSHRLRVETIKRINTRNLRLDQRELYVSKRQIHLRSRHLGHKLLKLEVWLLFIERIVWKRLRQKRAKSNNLSRPTRSQFQQQRSNSSNPSWSHNLWKPGCRHWHHPMSRDQAHVRDVRLVLEGRRFHHNCSNQPSKAKGPPRDT